MEERSSVRVWERKRLSVAISVGNPPHNGCRNLEQASPMWLDIIKRRYFGGTEENG